MSSSINPPSPARHSGIMPSCEAAVECIAVDCGELPAAAEVTRFRGANGAIECHIAVRLTGHSETDPLACLTRAYQRALDAAKIPAETALFRRVFCSDIVNQSPALDDPACGLAGCGSPCALSRIGQSPLPAGKFALWAYHVHDPANPPVKSADSFAVSCQRGALGHHWSTGIVHCPGGGAEQQTRRILEAQDAWLRKAGMNMADHVIRTWWFVQNIDADYQGLVEARRDFFTTHGLTAETHYIASTGIAGTHPDTAARVSLDAYSISGLRADQLEYLSAPDFLCPTHDYGVTFERAAAVHFADRSHVWISGTASIDRAGRIVHEGDVIRQLDRTLENIEALLAQAAANLGDLAIMLVYLRDPADGALVEHALRECFGTTPFILLHAPVCRPGWLIEIEGIAIISANRPEFPGF